MNPLQSATFVVTTGAVTTPVTAARIHRNPANQQLHLHSKTLSPHLSPASLGRRRGILPARDRAERKREELSSFLQCCYYQIAGCKKLLPPPSHYVYLARSQYVERFSDSATEAASSTCAACSGMGIMASPHVARVTEPSPAAGGEFFASREMWSALPIFTNTGGSGTRTNSVSILVQIFLLTAAECSVKLWTVIDFFHEKLRYVVSQKGTDYCPNQSCRMHNGNV